MKTSRTEKKLTTLAMKQDTLIGYWNVQTMWEAGKLAQIEAEMLNYKLSILGISEARWNSFGELQTANGNTLLYSGREEEEDEHREGVAILLSKEAKKSLMNWNPISNRILSIRLKTKVRPVTIVQCYAPTEVANEEVKDQFYGQLYETLRSIKKRDIIMVMGDFNAQLGCDNSGVEKVMGKYGIGVLNDNGTRFLEMCGMFDLTIGGTLFPHKNCHKISWVSPDLRTQNQIDHFAISRKFRSSLLDTRNKRGADIGSDHHLMLAKVRLKISRWQGQKGGSGQRFDIDRLKEEEINTLFCLELKNRFAILAEEENKKEDVPDLQIEQKWDKIKSTFIEVGEKVIGFKQKNKKPWISEGSWKMILQRKELKKLLNSAKTRLQLDTASNLYRLKNREVKRNLKRDKRTWTENLAEKAQIAANQNNTKELYKITKTLSGKPFLANRPIKDRDGKILVNEMDQINRWKQHFNYILNNNGINEEMEELDLNIIETDENLKINMNPITKGEIIKAIQEAKNGKAPGIDNINAEILKADPETTANILYPLFQNIWLKETVPKEWGKGVIVKLPKKGDLLKCDNWRGITLLSTSSKIFTRVILNRIKNALEKTLRKTQHGFRPQKSCTDLINTIRIIAEQSLEWNNPLYLVFIDFIKAFDMVNRCFIWKRLRKIGLPLKIINIIKNMYDESTYYVLHNGKLSSPFTAERGVKQGCLLSPLLFILVLDDLMSSLCSRRRRGIQWGLNERLESLEYADDVCLLAHRFSDINAKLQEISKIASTAGLEINKQKTKEMRIRNNVNSQLSLGGEIIEQVEEFSYLGSMITQEGGAKEDVETRIKKARGAFMELKSVWRSKQISQKLKIRLFNTNVKSILLYGCETWKATKEIEKKLQVFINRCLRNIMGIWWPLTISNVDLWKKADQKEISKEIKFRKWKWIGHVLRQDGGNIARTAFEWNPQGLGRRRGRPRMTWCNTVRAEAEKMGKSWNEIKLLARNRIRWRVFIKALCFQGE